MNAAAYLERIRYAGPMEPTREALFALQRAHLYAVPYENLDILAGRPLSLREEDLFEKIVARRRGGYCFELNELFGCLLRALGFSVIDLFARFLKGEEGIPMRRHHVLLVSVPGREDEGWVCDVGVGSGSPMEPVLLERNVEQERDGETYRFVTDPFLCWVLEEKKEGLWGPVYSFTLERQLPVDFQAASFFCEKAPESIFNKEPMLSLRRPGGRVTLDGDVFRTFDGAAVTQERAASEEQRRAWIAERFGIVL